MRLTLKNFQKNILLSRFTTFRIGGKAKYFFIAKNKEDLKNAVLWAKKNNLPFFILGGGSNILVSDKGFNGLIIKNEARNFKIKGAGIVAESGVVLDKLIRAAVLAGLSGLIEGSGIPGTLGGAVYGNAGWSPFAKATGDHLALAAAKARWEIGDFVESATLLLPNGAIEKVSNKWLQFKYRESRLKKIKGEKPVILEVSLILEKGKKKEIEKKRVKILKIRSKKIPAGASSGSVFKNPAKWPAGYLIDKVFLKGVKRGGAKISEGHGNFIINDKNGTAKDVVYLIKLAKKEVYKKFKIKLEEEIELIGF